MNLFQQIKRKILSKKKNTEDEFYKDFFTKNKSWSSYKPNEDEQNRLLEITTFIEKTTQSSTSSIIDIGCGRGWLANSLKKYGEIVGIEPVESVIEFAKKTYEGIDFQAMKPNEYLEENKTKKFNLAVSSEVLEHVADKLSFLKTINELLTSEGYLILTTPRKENFKRFTEVYGKSTYQPLEEWVSEKEIRILFHDSQFEIIDYKFFSPLPKYKEEYNIYQIWLCKKK